MLKSKIKFEDVAAAHDKVAQVVAEYAALEVSLAKQNLAGLQKVSKVSANYRRIVKSYNLWLSKV